MRFFLLLWMPLWLVAKVHYAKVEPFDTVVLKSAVSASVQEVNLDAEGKIVSGKRVIWLDDLLDKKNLHASKESLDLLQQMLEVNQESAKSLKSTMVRQKAYYERLSKLTTASKTQKDSAYGSYSTANAQYLGTREKIISLQKQILDMEYKIAQLEDSIAKKSVVLEDKYLYKLMVRKGDFVNPGTALAHIADLSQAKLVLFLDAEEYDGLSKRGIYLDGELTPYHFDKVWKVTDEKFISSYRAEIYIPAPSALFSKLMKVEVK